MSKKTDPTDRKAYIITGQSDARFGARARSEVSGPRRCRDTRLACIEFTTNGGEMISFTPASSSGRADETRVQQIAD